MIFTSLKFAIFFVVVFAVYYALPWKKRWMWLLAASYYFYLSASVKYVAYLLLTTVVTFVGANLLDKQNRTQEQYLKENKGIISREEKKEYISTMDKKRKWILIVVLILVLGQLGILKYSGFVLDNINALLSFIRLDFSVSTVSFLLPIGLSFYTFQSIGYVIDVYRDTYESEKNFFKHALFVSFFAQIMEGPIGSYSKLAPQLFEEHKFDYDRSVRGLGRAIWGFFKKRVLADHISAAIGAVLSFPNSYDGILTGLPVFFTFVLYAIEIYADFSGYTDMAIGFSSMLGIKLEENFDHPYFSKSIPEYWRRWHATLGAWFRNYVFYSVLRSEKVENLRKKIKNAKKSSSKYLAATVPTAIALAVVWLLTGLWHGADWSYVLHGCFHGSLIILSTFLEPAYTKFHAKFPGLKEKPVYGAFEMIRTFILVCIGYSIFWPGYLPDTIQLWQNLFAGLTLPLANIAGIWEFIALYPWHFICIAYSLVLVLAYDIAEEKGIAPGDKIRALPMVSRWILYFAFITLVAFTMSYGATESFLYFQF